MLLHKLFMVKRFWRFRWWFLAVAILVCSVNSATAEETCKKDADGLCSEQRAFIKQLNSRRNWRIKGQEQGKVFLGKPAEAGKYPWMVAIGISETTYSNYLCGGTLIAKQWIMTAAHCFVDGSKRLVNSTHFSALINEVDIRPGFSGDKARKIAEVYLPKDFNNDACEGKDVALLKLEHAFEIEDEKLAIPMTEEGFADSGHDKEENGAQLVDYLILGFGTTVEQPSGTSILNAAQVKSLSTSQCKSNRVYGNSILDDMICAGSLANSDGSDACKGDSGGGLVLQKMADGQGQNLVAGIVSWGGAPVDGKACAAAQDCTLDNPFRVGVYTRVASFEKYISACINGDCATSEFFELWSDY